MMMMITNYSVGSSKQIVPNMEDFHAVPHTTPQLNSSPKGGCPPQNAHDDWLVNWREIEFWLQQTNCAYGGGLSLGTTPDPLRGTRTESGDLHVVQLDLIIHLW
jgi:hypothetical protein